MVTVTIPPPVPQVYSRRSSNTAKHKVLLKRRNVILALVVSVVIVLYVLLRSHRPLFFPIVMGGRNED